VIPVAPALDRETLASLPTPANPVIHQIGGAVAELVRPFSKQLLGYWLLGAVDAMLPPMTAIPSLTSLQ